MTPRPPSRPLSLVLRVAGLVLVLLVACATTASAQAPPLRGPFPLFPADNWWNLDISSAPIDPRSDAFIAFINNGSPRRLHPDLGGDEYPGSVGIYGFPYVVVGRTQPKKAVAFLYADESDGVDHATGLSYPFYPIPDEAITQPHLIEGGDPGNVDRRGSQDRHLLIVDRDNKYLYELYNVYFDGTGWQAGSGAFFDMNRSDRRPDTWTSADAAGLAILPGLVRYDEVFGPDEIGHAFRVTVRATYGYVYPASHRAGSNTQALPMGARLRLKAAKDISGFPPEAQKIFRAIKKYGLIVADNGSDMYVSGTYDTRWDNDVLNPAFAGLTASDFEVVQLGWNPPSVCSGSLGASAEAVAAPAGSVAVAVTASSGCSWGATSTTGWITVVAPSTVSGNGTITLAVGANPGAASRVGTATIAGETFTVLQAGSTPLVARYFAEGSAGGILGFRCRFALANADPATPANVVLRFLKSDGTSTAQYVQVPPSSRRTVDADTLAALADSAFSTVVESDGSSWPTAR